jgi:hypothetical protein
MRKFVQRHQEQILGVLSGFDRMRFRGTLRLLQSEGGVATWLGRVGVAVKDFLSLAEGLTKRFCRQADQQPKIKWMGQLDRVLRRVHPLHREVFRGAGALEYYWTSEQTEWATDVVFRDAETLSHLYQTLVRRGIDT